MSGPKSAVNPHSSRAFRLASCFFAFLAWRLLIFLDMAALLGASVGFSEVMPGIFRGETLQLQV